MKIKIFNTESGDFTKTEDSMNKWLEGKNITISNVVFSSNEFRFVLIIFYTENNTTL